MKKQKFDILSPDGFSIRFDKTYPSIKSAQKDFKLWLKGYERQGYYSSVKYGRIPLENVEEYCTIIEL